jgi:hypothetical protein
MGQVLIVISTAVSALAALTIAVLTFFLVRATGRYVQATIKYARLVQEQLDLLRAQLAAPLLVDVIFVQATAPQLIAKCRHSGNPSSLPAIIKAVSLRMSPLQGGGQDEVSDGFSLNDILGPGKTWTKSFGGKIAVKIGGFPAPGLWRALFHGGPRQQTAARLSVTLRFQRGGQTELEEVTREYEVRTRHFGGPTLVPL